MAMHIMQVRVRLPDGHWAGDISREMPQAVLRIEEHMPLRGGRGKATAAAVGVEPDRFVALLSAHPGLERHSLFEAGERSIRFSVSIAKGGGGFIRPLIEVEVTPHTPFDVRDGWVDWTIEVDASSSVSLIEQMEQHDIPHKLISLRRFSKTRLLTPRQREVFDLALTHGYYSMPRRVDQTQLAGMLGISRSTVCGILQGVQQRVMGEFADEIRSRSPGRT